MMREKGKPRKLFIFIWNNFEVMVTVTEIIHVV